MSVLSVAELRSTQARGGGAMDRLREGMGPAAPVLLGALVRRGKLRIRIHGSGYSSLPAAATLSAKRAQ
jgi:hypothetical protein